MFTEMVKLKMSLMLLLIVFVPSLFSAPMQEQQNEIESYNKGQNDGCMYNLLHYKEGQRIITNEPCLNCTCHDRMLRCYLRVCPFVKAVGQECIIERSQDQCCPKITCPEVPVPVLSSTSTERSSNDIMPYSSKYLGCSISQRWYVNGERIEQDRKNPCQICYCIRNETACIMQECTLNVPGCKPVFKEGFCCPVKYECEDRLLLESQTVPSTTTSTLPPLLTAHGLNNNPGCYYKDRHYDEGALIESNEACEHCYCMKGNLVCAIKNCGAPLEKHANCQPVPTTKNECCPETYICDNEVLSVDSTITEINNLISNDSFINRDLKQSMFGSVDEINEHFVHGILTQAPDNDLLTQEYKLDKEFSEKDNVESSSKLYYDIQNDSTTSILRENITISTINSSQLESESDESTQLLNSESDSIESINKINDDKLPELKTEVLSDGHKINTEKSEIFSSATTISSEEHQKQLKDHLNENTNNEPDFEKPIKLDVPEFDKEINSSNNILPILSIENLITEKAKLPINDRHEVSENGTSTAKVLSTEPSLLHSVDDVNQQNENDYEENIVNQTLEAIRLVPGEGSCRVDEYVYDNNSFVPVISRCQLWCKCISSIIKCESIACPEPPKSLLNCSPIMKNNDCCPIYTCETSSQSSLESESHSKTSPKEEIILPENVLITKSTNSDLNIENHRTEKYSKDDDYEINQTEKNLESTTMIENKDLEASTIFQQNEPEVTQVYETNLNEEKEEKILETTTNTLENDNEASTETLNESLNLKETEPIEETTFYVEKSVLIEQTESNVYNDETSTNFPGLNDEKNLETSTSLKEDDYQSSPVTYYDNKIEQSTKLYEEPVLTESQTVTDSGIGEAQTEENLELLLVSNDDQSKLPKRDFNENGIKKDLENIQTESSPIVEVTTLNFENNDITNNPTSSYSLLESDNIVTKKYEEVTEVLKEASTLADKLSTEVESQTPDVTESYETFTEAENEKRQVDRIKSSTESNEELSSTELDSFNKDKVLVTESLLETTSESIVEDKQTTLADLKLDDSHSTELENVNEPTESFNLIESSTEGYTEIEPIDNDFKQSTSLTTESLSTLSDSASTEKEVSDEPIATTFEPNEKVTLEESLSTESIVKFDTLNLELSTQEEDQTKVVENFDDKISTEITPIEELSTVPTSERTKVQTMTENEDNETSPLITTESTLVTIKDLTETTTLKMSSIVETSTAISMTTEFEEKISLNNTKEEALVLVDDLPIIINVTREDEELIATEKANVTIVPQLATSTEQSTSSLTTNGNNEELVSSTIKYVTTEQSLYAILNERDKTSTTADPEILVPGDNEEEYDDIQLNLTPGTCRYSGKIYVSAQQIPRDNPCDFCFCFRGDIICLEQKCPPPIKHCKQEPIDGYCCPRFECPVLRAIFPNATVPTTTTTTTTTARPRAFYRQKLKSQRKGCQFRGKSYKVNEEIKSASGPCLDCVCGGDGQMQCNPKVCSPGPTISEMIQEVYLNSNKKR